MASACRRSASTPPTTAGIASRRRSSARRDRVWDWGDLQIVRSAAQRLARRRAAPVMVDAFRDPRAGARRRRSIRRRSGEHDRRARPADRGRARRARRRGVAEVTNRGAVGVAGLLRRGRDQRALPHLPAGALVWRTASRSPGVGDVIAAAARTSSPGETVEMRALADRRRRGRVTSSSSCASTAGGRRPARQSVGPDALRVPVGWSDGGARARRPLDARWLERPLARQALISSRQAAKTARRGRPDPRCRRRRRRTPSACRPPCRRLRGSRRAACGSARRSSRG